MPFDLNRREWLVGAVAALAPFFGSSRSARAQQQPEAWANWSRSVEWHPRVVERPVTVDDVVAAVRASEAHGDPLRVAGTGHSFVPLTATDGSFVLPTRLAGVQHIDNEGRRATVLAGTKLSAIDAPIHEAGLAMSTLPDIDRQSLAGAISTATHGTGREIGNLSSLVTSLRLVNATGEVVSAGPEENADLFQAARVSMGLLGVLTEIELQLVPAFMLHEKSWVATYDEMAEGLESHIAGHRHFEFFWVSGRDACLMKSLDPTDESEDWERQGADGLSGERVGSSGAIFPSVRNRRFNEIEYALPAEAGPGCLAELRQLMLSKHAAITWPLEYRTVAADDMWLSPAYGRATVTISAHQANELDHRPFFDDVEAIFRNHNGRPHWGKMHSLTARELRDLYPRFNDFVELRQEMDPKGRFLTPYCRELMVG
ncbi:MAG: D-arabinono-1,4-lactone oxidase [Acidobacteriota bacterium]|nr:D-arabinono-1,4-lactone oxidase [Acidobacteriota bacterium]